MLGGGEIRTRPGAVYYYRQGPLEEPWSTQRATGGRGGVWEEQGWGRRTGKT